MILVNAWVLTHLRYIIHYDIQHKKKGKWHMIVDRIYELTTMFMGFVIWNFDFSFSLSLPSLCIYTFFWFIFCYVKNIKLHNTIWYTIQTHARTCMRTHTHNTIYKLTATFLGFNYLKFWAPPFSLSLCLCSWIFSLSCTSEDISNFLYVSMSLLLYQSIISIYLSHCRCLNFFILLAHLRTSTTLPMHWCWRKQWTRSYFLSWMNWLRLSVTWPRIMLILPCFLALMGK